MGLADSARIHVGRMDGEALRVIVRACAQFYILFHNFRE